MIDPKELGNLVSQSSEHLDQAKYQESEESLLSFMKNGWHNLEPGRPLEVGWVTEAICDHLEAVTRGDIRFLLINVPPGSTKSMTTSVFWHAWEWGPKGMPQNRFIKTSYAQNLAVRDNMRARDLIKSEWYQKKWPIGWKPDKDGKTDYENTHTGWSMAASSGSQLTGFRGDRIIVDDPHSVQSAESDLKREAVLFWFAETLPTRFNDMNHSALVVIMQRLHERDVSGLILAEELGYEHLMIPMEYEPYRKCYSIIKPSYMEAEKTEVVYNAKEACWQDKETAEAWLISRSDEAEDLPEDYVTTTIDTWKHSYKFPVDPRREDDELMHEERFNREAVDRLKRSLAMKGGQYAIAGQLQQRPVPRGGGMFQREDFQILDELPEGPIKWSRGWDLAASDTKKSPRTAGVKMGKDRKGRYIIADVTKGRWNPGDAETNILKTVKLDGITVKQSIPQDPGQAGKVQKLALTKLLAGFTFTFSPESGTKEDRARPLAAQAENGNLYVLRGPWLEEFLDEACSFPNGAFKDQVDAASRAFGEVVKVSVGQDKLGFSAPIIIYG